MLERAALHQTRYRTPGVAPDGRGVILGERGLVLFPSLDRVVSFLRAYSDEGSVDELLPSLEIHQVSTPLRTRELVVSVYAESSYRMDRIAGIARLVGGSTFTGTQRHFVRYRDSASPLGYDVQELLDDPADIVVYDEAFRQTYSFERRIPLRELVFKLTPQRLPPAPREIPGRLLVTAEPGMGTTLVGYLFRWRVRARAALAEWPPESAFEDRPRRLHVFDLRDAPPRVVSLLESLPGVHVFEPLTVRVAVQRGYRHPIALESCASLFEDDALYLFRADGETTRITPVPPFADVRTLVRIEVPPQQTLGKHDERAEPDVGSMRGAEQGPGEAGLSLSLRLAPSQTTWRNVIASVVPMAQRQWLGRLLYALPPHELTQLQIAIGKDRFFLVDASGIEGVPLGTFYREAAPRVYVPAGLTLIPAVGSEVLDELLAEREDGHVFFHAGRQAPEIVPASSFGPVSRRILREVGAVTVHPDRPADADPPLPELRYERPRRFPLWGVARNGDEAAPRIADGTEEPSGGGQA